MEQIDYFKGVTNQEFIDYYKVDLYSRMEITLYTYPNELTEEEPIPWEHLNRCQEILYEFLYNAYAGAKYDRWLEQHSIELEDNMANTGQEDEEKIKIEQTPEEKTQKYALEQKEREEIVKAKMQELMPELNKVTDDYMKKVKLSYVDL